MLRNSAGLGEGAPDFRVFGIGCDFFMVDIIYYNSPEARKLGKKRSRLTLISVTIDADTLQS